MPSPLERLAERAGEDPFFLGHALRAYRETAGLDKDGLAGELGCTASALTQLALCRRPGFEGAPFAEDVERIAAEVGVDAGALANVVRLANALGALWWAAPQARGSFLAARDREDLTDAETPERQ